MNETNDASSNNHGARQRAQIFAAAEALSASLSGVLSDAAFGRHPGTVDQLINSTGVSRKLAWQILRLADGESHIEDLRNLPGKQAFPVFLRAAKSIGVAGPLINSARDAYEDIETLIAELGGDRQNFLEIAFHLHGIHNQTETSVALRNAYRANSRIWGISARTLYSCWFFRPVPDRERDFDLVFFSLQIAVRPQSLDEFDIRRHRVRTGRVIRSSPIADQATDRGCPFLLEPFCSGSLPTLVSRKDSGFEIVKAKYDSMGIPGEHSLAFGEIIRIERSRADGRGDLYADCWMPCEEIVSDVFFDRSTNSTVINRMMCSQVTHPTSMNERSQMRHALDIPIEVSSISHPVENSSLTGYPPFRDLSAFVLQSLGWDAEEFVGHRSRVAFPPIGGAMYTDIQALGD